MEEYVCTNCGEIGKPKTLVKGNLAIEILIWVFFWWTLLIVPLVYSIWRLTSKQMVCPRCNQGSMIPVDTLRGKQLADEFKKTSTRERNLT